MQQCFYWRCGEESGFERVARHQDRGLERKYGMQSAAHTHRALRIIIIFSPLQIYRTSTRDVTARRRFDQQQPLTCRSNTTVTVAPTSARSTLTMYSLLLPSPCMEPRQRTAFSFTTTSPMVSRLDVPAPKPLVPFGLPCSSFAWKRPDAKSLTLVDEESVESLPRACLVRIWVHARREASQRARGFVKR